MKTINSNENNPEITEDLTKIEDCPFVLEINKRYGIKIQQFVIICDESKLNRMDSTYNNLSFITPRCVLAAQVQLLTLRNLHFNSIDELYRVTKTGQYSKEHKVNQDERDWQSVKKLIPVILIRYKRKTYSFLLTNQIIREIFEDTLLNIKNSLSNEDRELVDRRFLKQKEYLDYCFAPYKSNLSCDLWIRVHNHKLQSNQGHMLHSEYYKKILDEHIASTMM